MTALTSQLRAIPFRHAAVSAVLGAWAASIALAPTLEEKSILLAPGVAAAILLWSLWRPGRWLYLFFFAILALPPLPVPGGDSGLHIAPLAAGVGVLVGLLRLREWRKLRGGLALTFVAFVTVLLISTIFAAMYSGTAIAAGSLARVLLFSLGVYVCLYTLVMEGRDSPDPISFMRFLFFLATAAAIFACIDFYFQLPAPAGYGPQFVWLDQGMIRRAQGLFYEASTLGNFCAFFLVLILVCLFRPRSESPFARLTLIAAGFAFAAALIFSYSRGSIVNVIVAGGAFIWLRRDSIHLKASRVLAAGAGLLLISGLAVQTLLPAFSAKYWSRIAASVQYVSSSPDSVLSGRLTNWMFLADFLRREPWIALFGVGYKTLPYSDVAGGPVVADNTYLQLLVETGVVGLLAFMALNAAILRTGLRATRSSTVKAQLFGEWIFCFWAGQMAQMFSGDLITYWRVLPLYFWVLAIAANQADTQP
jgi:O-antigen ligase